jgi:hypothetical protein
MNIIHQYFLIALEYTHTHQFYFYWLPVLLCIFGYLRRNQEEYKSDIAKRAEYEADTTDRKIYHPTITVGKVVGRFVVAFLPLVNIWKSVTDFIPRIVKDVIDLFNDWLDIPLVKERGKPAAPVAPETVAGVTKN